MASGPLHEIYRTLALDRAIHCTLAEPPAPWLQKIGAIPGVASVQELPDRLLIRLREEAETTFVDVRVASPYGQHDLGFSAGIAEEYLKALDAELLGIAGG